MGSFLPTFRLGYWLESSRYSIQRTFRLEQEHVKSLDGGLLQGKFVQFELNFEFGGRRRTRLVQKLEQRGKLFLGDAVMEEDRLKFADVALESYESYKKL